VCDSPTFHIVTAPIVVTITASLADESLRLARSARLVTRRLVSRGRSSTCIAVFVLGFVIRILAFDRLARLAVVSHRLWEEPALAAAVPLVGRKKDKKCRNMLYYYQTLQLKISFFKRQQNI
jgi:hypothetical protein